MRQWLPDMVIGMLWRGVRVIACDGIRKIGNWCNVRRLEWRCILGQGRASGSWLLRLTGRLMRNRGGNLLCVSPSESRIIPNMMNW